MASPRELLATYRSKRDFKKTREPSGAERAAAGGNVYMIQKHDATRLHYDFRLELDGVLKSWAVTRGPSLNPEDKRLAVQTEDHPLAYATFEGTIPSGEYGGGTVMLWDRGTWEPLGDAHKELAKGHLRFRLLGERLQGEWHLVRMHGHRKGDAKRTNWLLIKSDDDVADCKNGDRALEEYIVSVATGQNMASIAANGPVYGTKPKKAVQKKALAPKPRKQAKPRKAALPEMMPVQLATLVDAPPKGEGWVHEIKFDGYRLLARIARGKVTLLTRTGQDWTHKFQPIADALAALKLKSAMLDGEVVAVDAEGTMSFAGLQRALKDKDTQPLRYFAFDLPYLEGEDLTPLPLTERKARLKQLIPEDHDRLRYSEDFDQAGTEVLDQACQIDLEGIISKRADAPYSGGRGDDWLKSKCLKEQEFVIGGFTEQEKHPGMLGALLVGYYEEGELRYAGKVGTGFTGEESRKLLRQFKKVEQSAPSFATVPGPIRRHAHWITPDLVAQVRFTEWTTDGMLRHPAFLGLREDKPAGDVVREREKKIGKQTAGKPARPSKPTKSKDKSPKQGLVIEGVGISHPEKPLYPNEQITKQDLAEYYQAVAPWMLPHMANRPISLLRCPDGLRSAKACFFQRHAGDGSPEQLKQVKVESDNEPYLYVEDASGLIALVQLGVLEVHAWGSTAKKPDRPDRITFDFDPHEDVPWRDVKKAAQDMRAMLEKLGLKSFLKTTGGKGLHVVVPITQGPSWDEVRNFSEALSQILSEANPGKYTLNNRKSERVGRIFLDYLRNDESASAIAPYSTRAKPGAPIALPIEWDELPRLKSAHEVTVKNAAAKLARRKRDPWAEMLTLKQKLPKLT